MMVEMRDLNRCARANAPAALAILLVHALANVLKTSHLEQYSNERNLF
jgi:hypothetical protein